MAKEREQHEFCNPFMNGPIPVEYSTIAIHGTRLRSEFVQLATK